MGTGRYAHSCYPPVFRLFYSADKALPFTGGAWGHWKTLTQVIHLNPKPQATEPTLHPKPYKQDHKTIPTP
jgi:hypothetical protein